MEAGGFLACVDTCVVQPRVRCMRQILDMAEPRVGGVMKLFVGCWCGRLWAPWSTWGTNLAAKREEFCDPGLHGLERRLLEDDVSGAVPACFRVVERVHLDPERNGRDDVERRPAQVALRPATTDHPRPESPGSESHSHRMASQPFKIGTKDRTA